MVAMTAARLGEPDLAVGALLLDTPKNRHAQRPQLPASGLTVYLPGNGGLLTAVAMMAAGWDGAPARQRRGSPTTGSGRCGGRDCAGSQ